MWQQATGDSVLGFALSDLCHTVCRLRECGSVTLWDKDTFCFTAVPLGALLCLLASSCHHLACIVQHGCQTCTSTATEGLPSVSIVLPNLCVFILWLTHVLSLVLGSGTC